jgi:hypothetical protein
MRGHASIINLRLNGRAPGFVFINDYPCQTDWFQTKDFATVSTFEDDLNLLDLRFVNGLKVSISSHDEGRARDLFERCKEAGAVTVAACHIQTNKPGWAQCGWLEIFHA